MSTGGPDTSAPGSTDRGPASDAILLEVDGGVAVITLNRPEALNAFGGGMTQALEEAYRTCDADDSVRAVVVTGAGRAFCAGADFSSTGDSYFSGVAEQPAMSSDPFTFPAWKVRKPVIAAVNGHAIGVGMTIPLHCDLRIMATGARYAIVMTRRGVIADLRAHWVLPRLIGMARATELLLTGRQFTAEEAERWGLANEARPPDEVLPRALEVARDFAMHKAPVPVALSKRLLWMDPPPDRDEMLELESEYLRVVFTGDDAREGVAAFLQKREPQWSGRVTDTWASGLGGRDR